jgi:3-hydroxyacyl-[acyl-carrier-protein] dehydratase
VRFILIDEILELVPGKYIRGVKHIDPGEDYFRDHFPGFPVVPGVLLTEMMAQTAGKCLDMEDLNRGKSMLVRINVANFRGWVRPGETATIIANISLSQPQIATALCRVEIGERKVASADLVFSFVPSTQFAPDYRDEVLERFLDRSRLPAPGSTPAGTPTPA